MHGGILVCFNVPYFSQAMKIAIIFGIVSSLCLVNASGKSPYVGTMYGARVDIITCADIVCVAVYRSLGPRHPVHHSSGRIISHLRACVVVCAFFTSAFSYWQDVHLDRIRCSAWSHHVPSPTVTTTLAQSAWTTIAEGATQGSSLERSKLRVCADQVGQSNQMSANQSKCPTRACNYTGALCNTFCSNF